MDKFNENFFEYQTTLNLTDIYSNDEIISLKNLIPDLNNQIFSLSNITKQPINSLKLSQDKNIKSPKNNIKQKLNLIEINKFKFYKLIIEKVKSIIEKNDNILAKALSQLIEEFLSVSKIIKQNKIYNNFFSYLKNQKAIGVQKVKNLENSSQYSANKNIRIQVRCKSEQLAGSEIIPKRNYTFINDVNKSFNKKCKNCNEIISTENNGNIKKHLSFDSDVESNHLNKDKNYKSCKNINNKTSSIILCNKGPNVIIINNTNSSNKSSKIIKNNNKINTFHKKNNISMLNDYTTLTKYRKKNYFLSQIALQKETKDKKKKNDNKKYNTIKNSKNTSSVKIKSKENKFSLSSLDPKLLENIDCKDFDIFELVKKVGRDNILPVIGYYIYNKLGFNEIIKFDKYEKWCRIISEGYIHNNYYHNDLHAADVTQTCLIYLLTGEVKDICKFNKNNMIALILSCMCHDFKHPGVNNNFLKETNNCVAIRYNDNSILENMHISETFNSTINNNEMNIFENIDKETYKEFRKEMISCVLATDMAFHKNYHDFQVRKLEEKKKGENKENDIDKQLYMDLFIHSADISNPTKIFSVYFKWAKFVVDEFWDQGDKEKKLGMKCSCDREKVTIYQNQLGFINFIELPYFVVFAELFPKLKFYYDNLNENKKILLAMQEKDNLAKKAEDKKEDKK